MWTQSQRAVKGRGRTGNMGAARAPDPKVGRPCEPVVTSDCTSLIPRWLRYIPMLCEI